MLNQDLVTYLSFPLIVAFILLEMLVSSYKNIKLYHAKETITNVYLTVLSMLCNLVLRGFYIWIYTLCYDNRLFEISNVWLYWITLVVFQDFLYYLLHCADHYIRLFWAVHVTHHSSTEYNISTGFRSSVFEATFRFAYFIPLALIGFNAINIMLVYSIVQFWGVLIHTRLIKKVPKWIGYVFVTPAMHRVHHGSNVLYLDKNMGMFLIIWDRLFGTFQEELDEEPVVYGLVENVKDRGALNIVFHEFKSMMKDLKQPMSFKNRLNYIFNAPGWSHNGSKQTSAQMRHSKYGL